MEASALRAPAGIASRRPGGVLLRLRSDEQLVALFRQGNEDAFRIIHDRYRQRLSAYARQMLSGSSTDADDAMQDVFLRAYAALRADERPVTLRAWLYRVAHNRCIDHIRRPASQPMLELSEETRPLPATTGDPILAAERREDLRRLVLDVRALPEQQRSALLMREMEGLSYQELAGALDVTIPAVKSLLVRARMGLVESQQARDTPCQEIREDITSAHDRGVRASGRARRHTKECPGCAGYRATLKGVTDGLHSLSPSSGPWAFLAKLIGLGAGGSGAAGGAAAAGGAGAGAGAMGATGTVAAGAAASKLAAVVCCAALVGGGAVEVAREQRAPKPSTRHASATSAAAAAVGKTASASRIIAGLGASTAGSAGATRSAKATATARAERLRELKLKAHLHRSAPAVAITAADMADQGGLLGEAAPITPLDKDGGASGPAEDPAVTGDPTTDPAATDPAATGDGTGTGTGGTTAGSSAGTPSTVSPGGGTTSTGTAPGSGSGTTTGAPGTTSGSTVSGGPSSTGPTTPGGATGGGGASAPSGPIGGGSSAPVPYKSIVLR